MSPRSHLVSLSTITQAQLVGTTHTMSSLCSLLLLLVCLFLLTDVCDAFRSIGFRSTRLTRDSSSALLAIYKVKLQKEGETIGVLDVPEDVLVLDAAIDAGIEIPYDCKLGTYVH